MRLWIVFSIVSSALVVSFAVLTVLAQQHKLSHVWVLIPVAAEVVLWIVVLRRQRTY